ncbi:MAG TPA: DUF3761 domain-containing protein [Baekduia sp.]|uniref:DUF3761 domain-containing protein n=1 Tax=Baekduia sp. TaxID=2600305 RepID=UPI002C9A3E3B|nr:DUF3761 domain-containing protein [Baekduia sp.]HMJ36777.1 DUF3761 domain-containing protein [Baekduia sp.]
MPAAAPAVTAPASASTSTTRSATRHKPRNVWKNCDTNIKARVGTTSCAFAENVFYGFWRALEQGDDGFRAYSPVTHRRYAMTCAASLTVTCRAEDGGSVRFSRASVDLYTDTQAEAFCRSRAVTPTEDTCDPPIGSQTGSGTSDQTYSSPDSSSPNGTPDSSYDSSPPVDESDYSDHDGTYNGAPTTEDFGNGQGSVGQCADGTYSDSIGRSGACSHHGGVG